MLFYFFISFFSQNSPWRKKISFKIFLPPWASDQQNLILIKCVNQSNLLFPFNKILLMIIYAFRVKA